MGTEGWSKSGRSETATGVAADEAVMRVGQVERDSGVSSAHTRGDAGQVV